MERNLHNEVAKAREPRNPHKGSDMIFYFFDEKGALKVLTTIDRPLTKKEFDLVEQNLAAYRYMLENNEAG